MGYVPKESVTHHVVSIKEKQVVLPLCIDKSEWGEAERDIPSLGVMGMGLDQIWRFFRRRRRRRRPPAGMALKELKYQKNKILRKSQNQVTFSWKSRIIVEITSQISKKSKFQKLRSGTPDTTAASAFKS